MSSGGGQTITNSEPWSGAQPYIYDVMGTAKGLYNWQNDHPAPWMTDYTTKALNILDQNAGSTPQPLQDANTLYSQSAGASNPYSPNVAPNALATFAGGNAVSNPYLDQMFGRAADKVRDYTNAQFTAGGRGGSVTNQDVLGKNISDLAAQMYGSAYETGQNRQLTAAQSYGDLYGAGQQQQLGLMGLAPQLSAASLLGPQALLNAGQYADTFETNRYNQPWRNLQGYSGAVTGLGGIGGTSMQTAPSQSMIPQLLGTAMSALPYFL